jgi:hypothetical protein
MLNVFPEGVSHTGCVVLELLVLIAPKIFPNCGTVIVTEVPEVISTPQAISVNDPAHFASFAV